MFDDTNQKIILLNIKTGYKQHYATIKNFTQNANIDGISLKNLWQDATNTDFLQRRIYMGKNLEKNCLVCKNLISTDNYGQGRCQNCGWFNDLLSEENPEKVVFPNVTSLKKARELIAKGEKILPSIEDFCEMLNFYGEVEFTYNGISYDIFRTDNEGKIEYGCSPNFAFNFKNGQDFILNAKTIDGKLLKDVWSEVEDAKYI